MTSGTRVLVVEDDPSISRLLELELGHRRFTVRVVPDGLAALVEVVTFQPDVIVLDILLPGMDGERVLATLRQQGIRTPVVMLTARDAVRDKVHSLETGADDYLTKPFDIDELVARIGSVLRRVVPEDRLRLADLTIDRTTRQVWRGGVEIMLTAREYDLLELLGRNARRVLPRATILDAVWREAPDVDPNVVDVYIGYLRRKIDRDRDVHLIRTVRGVGFTLREG